MALYGANVAGTPGPLKKTSINGPPKQNIALVLHSSTMTVAPFLHLIFRTKVEIMYSIRSDNFFRDHYDFGAKMENLDIDRK